MDAGGGSTPGLGNCDSQLATGAYSEGREPVTDLLQRVGLLNRGLQCASRPTLGETYTFDTGGCSEAMTMVEASRPPDTTSTPN